MIDSFRAHSSFSPRSLARAFLYGLITETHSISHYPPYVSISHSFFSIFSLPSPPLPSLPSHPTPVYSSVPGKGGCQSPSAASPSSNPPPVPSPLPPSIPLSLSHPSLSLVFSPFLSPRLFYTQIFSLSLSSKAFHLSSSLFFSCPPLHSD